MMRGVAGIKWSGTTGGCVLSDSTDTDESDTKRLIILLIWYNNSSPFDWQVDVNTAWLHP